MVFPLTVFSLLLIVLLLAGQLWTAPEPLRTVLWKTVPVYLLLAVYALLSVSFIGKPGLAPQYLAWLIVAVQVLRALILLRDRNEVWVRAGGVIVYLALGYLWFLQLPFFSQLPP